MTMNREMLLERLQNQYLTRQEVLFRLPLNISIDSFWPELVQRRKLSGVVLPLHRSDGKPLWYVLTNRMIAPAKDSARWRWTARIRSTRTRRS